MTQLHLINLKNVFLYEIGRIAICEVSPPFDEEQQYWIGSHTSLSTAIVTQGLAFNVINGVTCTRQVR